MGGGHCMYIWAYIVSLDYRIPTRNNVLIATISKIWRLNTKTFQNLCLPLNHPTSMPNMSANKKQSQNKNNKKQNCENNVWFRLKRCFSLLFFGFKSQKQKDHEFFGGVSHFRWNTFWFLLFWFYV